VYWPHRRRLREQQRWILPQHGVVEFAQFVTWLDPKLVDEFGAAGSVGRECFSLPA
jgi:hypothetical protein